MNGLLVAPLINGHKKNIGDYIQSVAQEQYWDKIDCYVEREKLASFYSDEKVNLIMQGWFMWTASEFPPSECINPFFISFHLQPLIAKDLLTVNAVNYLKRYEPIGCRDYGTKKLLEEKGIECYYSGCLTLTLDLKYHTKIKTDDIFIVDPYYEIGGSKQYTYYKRLSIILKEFALHANRVLKIRKKYSRIRDYKKNIKGLVRSLIESASLYHTYSKYFSDELLFKAKYITHIITETGMTENDKLVYARTLIKQYGSAKMVITSRIHAALPAMALNTSTIFVNSNYLQNEGSAGAPAGRLEGILELMNYITLGNDSEYSEILKPILQNGKIGSGTEFSNPSSYQSLAEELKKRTLEFVNKSHSGGGNVSLLYSANQMAA